MEFQEKGDKVGMSLCSTPKAKSHLLALALGKRRMRKELWRSRRVRGCSWSFSQKRLMESVDSSPWDGRCWAHPSPCSSLGWLCVSSSPKQAWDVSVGFLPALGLSQPCVPTQGLSPGPAWRWECRSCSGMGSCPSSPELRAPKTDLILNPWPSLECLRRVCPIFWPLAGGFGGFGCFFPGPGVSGTSCAAEIPGGMGSARTSLKIPENPTGTGS